MNHKNKEIIQTAELLGFKYSKDVKYYIREREKETAILYLFNNKQWQIEFIDKATFIRSIKNVNNPEDILNAFNIWYADVGIQLCHKAYGKYFFEYLSQTTNLSRQNFKELLESEKNYLSQIKKVKKEQNDVKKNFKS